MDLNQLLDVKVRDITDHIWLVVTVFCITVFAATLLFSSGCMLDTESFFTSCNETDTLFVGGCFEHVDGRDSGYLIFNNLDPSCNFSGIATNLTELGPLPEDIWGFFGYSLDRPNPNEQRAEITATWANAGGSEESFKLDAFYFEDSETMILRQRDSRESVNLVMVPCMPE